MPLHHDEDVIVHVDNVTFFLMNITYLFTASLPHLFYAGLSLRFQVAGYLLLVAGEVASSHEAPTPKKFLKYNFYRFPKGITTPKKTIFVKSRAIISGFMMVTSLLKKTFWDTKIISFYFT